MPSSLCATHRLNTEGCFMSEIYIMPINEGMIKDFDYLARFCSIKRQHKISLLESEIEKKICLYSELLIRYLACKKLKINNNDICICRGKYGKPYLEKLTDFNFNISNTGNAIAAVLSNLGNVGIDIEKIRNINIEIANRFFSEKEREFVMNKNNKYPNLSNRFFDVWTKKESYVKYTGYGFSTPFVSFDVFNDNISNKFRTMRISEYIISVCGNEFDFYDINEIDEYAFEKEVCELLK